MAITRSRPSHDRVSRAAAATAVLFLLATPAAPAGAQSNETEKLESLTRELEQSRKAAETLSREVERLKQEIRTLRAESIATARKAQEHEAALSEIEARLADLEAREADKLAALKTRRRQLGGTLSALQRIAMLPPDALIAAPGSPIETARSAMLLRVAIPTIESRAALLRAELDDLVKLRQGIAVQRQELATTSEALAAERQRLDALIERKSRTRSAATAGQRAAEARARELAEEAKDLRDLLARLEEESRARAEREARELAERQAREEAERQAREAARREAQERAARAAREQLQRQLGEAAEPLTPKSAAPESATPESAAPELAARPADQEPVPKGAPASEPAPEPTPEAATSEPERRQEQLLALARPDNIRPFPDAGANLRMPARGRVVLRYGQAHGDESVSKGLRIRARAGAQVVAPHDGKVVYAGPFRRYGQILIIEHGGRYHTLLAGLDRIQAVVGQWLLAGEPVGVLGSPQNEKPELYFELRRAGQPINPLPWLATTGDKVQG